MNPAADTLALASIEVDVSKIEEGQSITLKWRGKPVLSVIVHLMKLPCRRCIT